MTDSTLKTVVVAFLKNYERVTINFIAAGIYLLLWVIAAVLALAALTAPLFIGKYVQHGLLPWEVYTTTNDTLSAAWVVFAILWYFVLGTVAVAANQTYKDLR